MNPDGYFVLRSPTNNLRSGQRALSPDPGEAALTMLPITPRYKPGVCEPPPPHPIFLSSGM